MKDRPLVRSTILLLVSDPIVRSVVEETLERAGYTVMAAGDLGQAVDRMNEVMPDLLIIRQPYSEFTGTRCRFVPAQKKHENEGSDLGRPSRR